MTLATALPTRPSSVMPLLDPGRRGRHAAGAVIGLLALLLVVASGWGPVLLDRSDPRSSPVPGLAGDGGPATAGHARAEATGLDVDGIVDAAAHTPRPVPGGGGLLQVDGPAYRATFDDGGFSFHPAGSATAFGVSLQAVERGGTALPLQAEPWTAAPGAASRPVAADVTERVTTRAGEAEWDLVLSAPPPGRGDLRVTAALDGVEGGATLVSAAGRPAWELGLHGGAEVRMDEIVVLDADGTELHRALPRIEGDRAVLDVPASALDHDRYPVTVDPTVSGAHPVSPTGFNPAVAFDGTNHLVVWEQQFGGDSDILGARLRGDGSFLSGPFLISTAAENEHHPDVAWNGSTYLVAWELRNAGPAPLDDYDLRGQRLNANGGFEGANFVVYGGGYSDRRWDSRRPSVAANGVDFFVVWEDNANYSALGWDVYGKTISWGGSVGFGTRYAGTARNETSPDVAWNGATYLIAYTHEFSPTDLDVYGQQVNPYAGLQLADGTFNGVAFQSSFAIAAPVTNQAAPSVASENQNPACQWCGNPPDIGGPFLVAWTDARGTSNDVWGAMVGPLGSVGAGFPISSGFRHEGTGSKSVTYNGVYLVAWLDITEVGGTFPRGVYAARVSRTGTVLDPFGFPIIDTPAIEMAPAVSPGAGTRWGVAYQTGTAVELRRVSPK